MKKILFVFRYESLNEIILEDGNLSGPTEFLYGMNHMSKNLYDVRFINAPRGKRTSMIRKVCNYIEAPFSKKVTLGKPIDILPLFFKQVLEADEIICVNDAISFGILFWKRLGLIKGNVYALIQSLPERYSGFSSNKKLVSEIKALLHHARYVLTLSDFVHTRLTEEFDVPKNRILTFPFGPDTDFWKPLKTSRNGGYILSVGNDLFRDYNLLQQAVPSDLKLRIVTRNHITSLRPNVEILQNITNENLRVLYQNCSFVVIPTKDITYESSGLSTCLQTTACGKALITADIPTIREVFKDKFNCVYYKPENRHSLSDAITTMNNNAKLRIEIEQTNIKTNGIRSCEKMADFWMSVIPS